MQIITEYTIITELNTNINENLKIKIDTENKEIILTLNANLIYTNILHKELIVGTINSELTKLLQMHLKKSAERETR